MVKKLFFGIEIDSLTMSETVQVVEERICGRVPTHLLGINADKINELDRNEYYDNIVKSAEIINADGASVVLASKILNKPLPERVAGIDLMQSLLTLSNQKGYPVYFLGAKQEVVSTMVNKLKVQYEDLVISGYRDGYFDKAEWETITDELKSLAPAIVFIGITSPVKEYLIDYFMKKGVNSVFMGVGGSFDVLSGKIKRAPVWMQVMNIEWLFRVIQEPRRLFKRYFVGNTVFIFKVLKEKISYNKKSSTNNTI
ncbi:glycosyltransferase, WecB/TagA/CpsF family [Enterococcus faecalis 13-SD-W-01]|nr:glycosyltransferase, WecB/TagA/CpsF family [Enterococcus faecalis 13-SD-W-01]